MKRRPQLSATIHMRGGLALFLLMWSSSTTLSAPKAECTELTPLYLQSVAQLRSTQEAYIASACNEHPESTDCKRLTLSGQEMISTLQMLSLKMKASDCDPTRSVKPALNRCERLAQMIKSAEQELTELKRKSDAQRCQVRRKAPTCRAYAESRRTPLNIIRAAEKKMRDQGCSVQREPLPKGK